MSRLRHRLPYVRGASTAPAMRSTARGPLVGGGEPTTTLELATGGHG